MQFCQRKIISELSGFLEQKNQAKNIHIRMQNESKREEEKSERKKISTSTKIYVYDCINICAMLHTSAVYVCLGILFAGVGLLVVTVLF